MRKIRIRRDAKKIIKQIRDIQRKIDEIVRDKRVIIYGAGVHTTMLLEYIDIPAECIRICDGKGSGTIGGIEVEKSADELLNWGEVIIVSSYYYQHQIVRELEERGYEKKIHQLYEENDQCPFYETIIEEQVLKKTEIDFDKNPYLTYVDHGKAEQYEENVERYFFDAVTKDYFLEYIERGDFVLDIGAGTGRLTMECKNKGAHVIAADTSRDMLDILKRKDPQIETVVVNGVELPYRDELFDKIVSCDAMVHFQNWKDFILEHKRVVKKGGYIIYNMVNDDHLKRIHDDKDIRTWYVTGGRGRFASVTRRELEEFCVNNDLELVKMYPYGFFVLTAFSYGLLSREEMIELEEFYMHMCKTIEVSAVIKEFENKIVRKLPEYMCESNMVVIRKK